MTQTLEDTIGYACVVARKFTNETSVSFQCNFPLNAEPGTINAELDKLTAILERQQDRIDVPTLERQIEREEVNIKTQEDLAIALRTKIDAGPDADRKVTNLPQMREQYNQALATIKTMRENVERAKKALEETKQKAA